MKKTQFECKKEAQKLGYTLEQAEYFEQMRYVIDHCNDELEKNPDLCSCLPKFKKTELLQFKDYAQKLLEVKAKKYLNIMRNDKTTIL